ncbi:MAG TPA: hypothetical protein VGP95_00480 [Gemmatimonadaceae bacterium]|jgi:hypothetical protein|nr:hypothetical protein [Gemmatimonadaceae bacterium]
MTSPSGLQIPMETAYTRKAAFAIELLDPMTLDRVSDGVTVTATGLRRTKGKPNTLGLFVWVDEDTSALTKVSIDTGSLPYESIDLTPGDLQLPVKPHPLTTVQLAPALSYSFARGTTGARGTLIEDTVTRAPVANAEIYLRWLDESLNWQEAPIHSHTTKSGDFVSVLRLGRDNKPHVDNGAVTVRVHALRPGFGERHSDDVQLPQGLITDPTTMPALTFAWDALQP